MKISTPLLSPGTSYLTIRCFICLLILFIVITSCRDQDPAETPPGPVAGGTLRTDFPRIGLSTEKLQEFQNERTGTPEWTDIIARMSNMADSGEPDYGFGAFHFAVAFAVTGESKFKTLSKELIFRIIQEPGFCDVTSSYLRAPDCTGQVALAADILFNDLSEAERNTIFDYLETNARNIVEVRNWSGWGWQEGNPAYRQLNNYYPGHLQTILHYALLAYDHRDLAKEYFELVVEEELPAALELITVELKGGHGAEGTWYDDKLFGHYAEVVLMLREATHGQVDFGKEYAHVFADYVKFRLYSFNPVIEENGKPQLYHLATGDQPAVADAKAIDLARLRLWLLRDVLKNTSESDVAGYVRYFEDNVDFEAKGWQREYKLYYLLHYDPSFPTANYMSELPKSFLAEGKGLAHYRTGWNSDALTASIHFSPAQGQRNSHWHFGEGAFYIWYKGWQDDHLNRVDGNGIRQNTGLMNTILVNNDEESQGHGDAHVLAYKADDNFMVVQGDASENYSGYLHEFERTFVVTDHVITVYDFVKKKNAADVVSFIVTSESGFQEKPGEPGKFTTENREGRLTVKPINPSAEANEQLQRLKVDFHSPETELNLIHALEAGDAGSSACTMLSLTIEVNADNFLGVHNLQQHRAYVHVVNKSANKVDELLYVASSANPTEHVVTGLLEGSYNVLLDGVHQLNVEVDASGIIHFETSKGGTITISK